MFLYENSAQCSRGLQNQFDLDPVYTRTDPNWYGSEMDPFQFFSSVFTGSDPNHCPFTLGTGLEQFHSLVLFESYKTQ